jgi:hypothetical protein
LGTSFTEFRSLSTETPSLSAHETQYAGRIKLFAALDAHCVSARRPVS